MSMSPARRAIVCVALVSAIAPAFAADPSATERASLGIVARDPMDFEREMWRLEGGAWVVRVKPDGAASRAGIGLDDVIASLDDTAIADSASLVAALGSRKPGDKVRVRIIRRGHPLEMDATLGATRPL